MTEKRDDEGQTEFIIRCIQEESTAPLKAEIRRLRVALTTLLAYAERQSCHPEDTHRGGVIRTICDECGRKWADDEGGVQPYQAPAAIAAARSALSQ